MRLARMSFTFFFRLLIGEAVKLQTAGSKYSTAVLQRSWQLLLFSAMRDYVDIVKIVTRGAHKKQRFRVSSLQSRQRNARKECPLTRPEGGIRERNIRG